MGTISNRFSRRNFVVYTLAALGSAVTRAYAFAKDKLFPVHIKPTEVEIKQGQAILKNEGLKTAVASDKDRTVKELQKLWSSVNGDQISLDASGRVVIDNEQTAKALSEFVEENKEKFKQAGSGNFFDNCSCVDGGCN